MDGNTSIRYLQNYIRAKDYDPARTKDYFLKLSEEVGELAQALRKGCVRAPGAPLQGTVDEELWDVIYYALALANCCDVDMETVIREKEAVNQKRYPAAQPFEPGR